MWVFESVTYLLQLVMVWLEIEYKMEGQFAGISLAFSFNDIY